MAKMQPPETEQELLASANKIAGLTLSELALRQQMQLPEKLLHAKGMIGQLLEQALGATAGVQSKPDFEKISIELKTIPIDFKGNPRESTYVCTLPTLSIAGLTWHQSKVYQKLAHVLWIPIESDPKIPIPHRKIGMPLLWKMPEDMERMLKQDWEELMEQVSLGGIETISAKQGVYLQIRPKAADSKALRSAIGSDGQKIQTLPRGFYLRAKFTGMILRANYSSAS